MASVIYPALPRPVDIRGIFDATDSGYKAGQDWQDERKGKAAFGQYLSSLYGGQSAPQASPQTLSSLAPAQQPKQPDYASQRVASAFGDTPGPLNEYYSALRSAESSGNDAAANPNSSATGRYQFTKGTWDGLMTTHPELGLTPDGITDPNQQERAVRALTAQNAKSLSGAGIPVNPGNLYAAHFLGAGGAGNVLKQADNTPMSALVSPEVIQANPQLANMTVGDFKQWTAGKVGGTPAASPAGPQVTGASGGLPAVPSANPASLLPPRDVMAALFQSKTTRPIAISLAQAVQGLRMDQNDPMARVKYATALAQLDQLQNPIKAPTVQQFYDEKTGQPYEAQWNPKTRAWDRVGGTKASSNGITVSPDGTVQIGGNTKLTEGQSKDVGFYTRGLNADKELQALDTKLADFGQKNADLIPLGVGNYLRTPEYRQAKRAADDFLGVILRKDSGAAIPPSEYEQYGKIFLPLPGDDAGTIAQKRRARQVALLAIRSGLGTAEAVAKANEMTLGLSAPNPGKESRPQQTNRTSTGIEWSVEP